MKEQHKNIVIVLGLCALLYALLKPTTGSSIDLLGLWLGTELSFKGEDPYDWRRLVAEKNAIDVTLPLPWPLWNPPWTFILLGPLSSTDFPDAVAWWFVFSLSMVAIVLVCGLAVREKFSAIAKISTVACIATFPPLISHLLTGHFLLPLTAVLFAGFYLINKKQRWWAGFVLSVTLLKPNLFLFLYTGLFIDCIHRKDLQLPIGATAGALLLVASTWIVNADLFGYYWAIFPGPADWRTFPLAPFSLPLDDSTVRMSKHMPWIIAAVIGMIKIKCINSMRALLLFLVPVSLLVAPHAHPYDFVVLIPSLLLADLPGKSILMQRTVGGGLVVINLLVISAGFDYFISYLYMTILCAGIALYHYASLAKELSDQK